MEEVLYIIGAIFIYLFIGIFAVIFTDIVLSIYYKWKDKMVNKWEKY